MTEPSAHPLPETLELFYRASRLPVCCFSGNALTLKYSHPVQDFNLPLLLFDSLEGPFPDLWYSFTPEYLYFGGIRLPQDSRDRMLLIGPTLLFECSHRQAEALCSRLGRRHRDLPAIQNYFTQTCPHEVESLLANLRLLCRLLDLPSAEEIPLLPFDWKIPYPVSLPDTPESDGNEEMVKNLEETLISCVSSGNLNILNRLISENLLHTSTTLSLNTTSMRGYILGANMLASRTAIDAGVSYELGNVLSGQYIEQILKARDASELSHLFFRLFQDYTAQVARAHTLPSDSPIVRQVQQYTIAHPDEKITPHLLAEHFHISCSYLCSHFKQETGMTISSFVQKEKIREAKRLLAGSQYAVAEISASLGFSSESYFCAVFKKETGMTPVSYRQSGSERKGS